MSWQEPVTEAAKPDPLAELLKPKTMAQAIKEYVNEQLELGNEEVADNFLEFK